MRSPSRSPGPWLAGSIASVLVALIASGCVAGATPSGRLPSPAAGSSITPTTPASESPNPTSTDARADTGPSSAPSTVPTTKADWGLILDAVPDTFPRYPDATTAQPPAEPVSDALETTASIDDVASWYQDALGSAGFATVDVSNPLEDGSRVLDAGGRGADCRVQLTFRPLGDSTMITVLYGAGCAGTSS